MSKKSKNFKSKITSKGQITIPSKLRNALNLKDKDYITFSLDSKNNVKIIKEKNDIYELFGVFDKYSKNLKTSLTQEVIENAIAQGASKNFH
jgi:AbrB family looped-hinge helix DNA binding protein